MRRVLSRMTHGGERRRTGVTAAPPPRRPPPRARITAVQARMFTPLGTAVTSGSGSGGGAAAQVDIFFSFGGVPFFKIQEHFTQVGTASGTYDPPPCAPKNGRPGFPFGFLGAGGRLPKARRGRVFIV